MSDGNGKAEVFHLVENVEDRVRRLEDERVSIVSGFAVQTEILKGIKEEVSDLSSFVKENSKEVTVRLSILENTDKKEEKKIEWRSKMIYSVVAALGSALALVVEHMVNH